MLVKSYSILPVHVHVRLQHIMENALFLYFLIGLN